MRDFVTINGVTGYLGENGTAYLNLENVARGLGFTRIAESGNEVIRWERLRGYLLEFNAVPISGHDIKSQIEGKEGMPEFIPENIFYKLCFKASNEIARRFQDKVTDEILPVIRKTGGYVANDEFFINTYFPYADESTKQMLKTNMVALREANKKVDEANKKIDSLETKLNESEKYWTIMKFNQCFNLRWDMNACQHNGKAASVYSRQHGYEIRKCVTNDERLKETNSYAYEVLEILFLPQRIAKGAE